MKYFIQTLGCQANVADSERVAGYLQSRGYEPTEVLSDADYVVINTCSIRQSAEDRVLSLVNDKLTPLKEKRPSMKIVLTGCMVGRAVRDKTGQELVKFKRQMPAVDEFLPIEEVGFDYPSIRQNKTHAWVSISNGCNNFCSFCIVPYSRGREVSRPFADIMHEVEHLVEQGYTQITLLGMNVNSYGSDLLRKSSDYSKTVGRERDFFSTLQTSVVLRRLDDLSRRSVLAKQEESRGVAVQTIQNGKINRAGDVSSKAADALHRASSLIARNDNFVERDDNDVGYVKSYTLPNGRKVKPVIVKHLGRYRIPTLFPYLLEEVSKFEQLQNINFVSSNPWDFSDELIDVIAKNPNITRTLHIALQAGDDEVLKRMNRWYTAEEYAALMEKMRVRVPNIAFTTDIIVGFPGETEEQFQRTVDLCNRIKFAKAYIAEYSVRPGTLATKHFVDDVPSWEKKRRFKVLDEMVNGIPHPEPLKVGNKPRSITAQL